MRSATAGPEVPETEAALPREAGGTLRWWALLVVIALVSGLAVWLTSPRFEIDTPSLVDDWSAIERSPDQLSDVARFGNPEEQRYRPGWILWNYVQWHTFDAPEGMVGPNVWNVLRIIVLVAGLTLLTSLALPTPRGIWETVLHAGLAGVPASLLVVTVPKFARDVARFGIQEPLLLGGMALGGSLLVLAARWLLAEGRAVPRWQTAAFAVAGSSLWIVGVYQKESSICALPLIAAVLFVGRDHLASWKRLSTRRRATLAVLGAVVVLPLVHVAIEIVRIVGRGDLVYDAEVDGGRGAASGLVTLWDWSHEVFSPRARQLVIGALVLVPVAAVFRRRIDVVALGVLATALLTLVFAGQSGVAVSRYYLPAYALVLVVFALSLGRLPRLVQSVGLLMTIVAFSGATAEARDEVGRWADEEQVGGALIRTVAELESSGCVVAMAGLDLETSEALPVLVGLERSQVLRTCGADDTYLIVRDYGEGLPLRRTCAPGALEPVFEEFIATVYRCSRLRTQAVRDPDLGLVDPEELVAIHRLRPTVQG